MTENGNEIDRFLTDAARRSAGDEVTISIRDFIAKWGAQRRGFWYVQRIQGDLDAHGLSTIPPFESGWIDNQIRLLAVRSPEDAVAVTDAESIGDDQVTVASSTGTALKVGSLKSAGGGLVSIERTESLTRAQSLMLQYDYSQLPVLSGARKLVGAVTWESIAQKRIHQADCELRGCTIAADVVSIDDDLLAHIPRIIDRGYVFVRAADETLCGIITPTDLSSNFLTLAGPFLLIGEVERYLRRVVSGSFTAEEIEAGRDERDPLRKVRAADDLTIGEVARLFEPRDRWHDLGWDIDRTVFLSALGTLTELRNEIMHFSPDPVEEDRLAQARNLLKWLKLLRA